MRVGKMHDIEDSQLRVNRSKGSRDNGEVFCHIVCNTEGCEWPPCHKDLFTDFYYIQQLCRITVQVDDVGCLPCRLCPCVHCHRYVSLGKGRGIIGAVTSHGDHVTLLLILTDKSELFFGL